MKIRWLLDAPSGEVVYPASLQWDPIVAQIDRPILVVRASFDQGYRITLQAFRVFPVAKSFPKLFLAKLWQSEKIVLCSLAVRRATRINNPRVASDSHCDWRNDFGESHHAICFGKSIHDK